MIQVRLQDLNEQKQGNKMSFLGRLIKNKKKLVIVVILIPIVLLIVNYASGLILTELKRQITDNVTRPWKNKLEQIRLTNKTEIDSLQGVISITTIERNQLEQRIKDMSDEIISLSDSLEGALSGVHIGEGVVDIDTSGTGTAEVDSLGNKTLVYNDDWIDIKVDDILENSPFFRYRFHFNVSLQGISKKDRYGNIRHIEKVWLVNPNNANDKREVRWTSTFVTHKDKIKIFRWWNWKAHSDLVLLDGMQYGLSVSPFTIGYDEWPSTTWIYLLGAGFSTDFEKRINLTVIPVKINFAQIVPNSIVKNLNASLIIGLNMNGLTTFRLGIGVTH